MVPPAVVPSAAVTSAVVPSAVVPSAVIPPAVVPSIVVPSAVVPSECGAGLTSGAAGGSGRSGEDQIFLQALSGHSGTLDLQCTCVCMSE